MTLSTDGTPGRTYTSETSSMVDKTERYRFHSSNLRDWICSFYLCIGIKSGFVSPVLWPPQERNNIVKYRGIGQSLETFGPITDPAILSASKGSFKENKIYRKSDNGISPRRNSGYSESEQKENSRMSISRIIGVGRALHGSFTLQRTQFVEFIVSANVPVSTYIVNKEGLDEFLSGKDIDSFGGFTNRRQHQQKLQLERGKYYLVITNESDEVATITYHVFH